MPAAAAVAAAAPEAWAAAELGSACSGTVEGAPFLGASALSGVIGTLDVCHAPAYQSFI